MIGRLAVLALVLSLAWLIVFLWERRRFAAPNLMPGITVVAGPHCNLCDPVVTAIRNADSNATLRVVDVSQVTDGTVRSLPTVFVVDESGELVLRRSGRSALADAAELARVSRERGPQPRASHVV